MQEASIEDQGDSKPIEVQVLGVQRVGAGRHREQIWAVSLIHTDGTGTVISEHDDVRAAETVAEQHAALGIRYNRVVDLVGDDMHARDEMAAVVARVMGPNALMRVRPQNPLVGPAV